MRKTLGSKNQTQWKTIFLPVVAMLYEFSPSVKMMDLQANSSLNETYILPTPPGHPYRKWLRICIIITIFVFSLIGNTSVCLWMWINKQFRLRRMNKFILNLTCADMLVTWFTMLSQIVFESIGTVWMLDDTACRIFKLLQNFSIVSSTYMVTSIAIDRAFAIVFPLKKPPSVTSFICFAWVCSLIPSLPSVFLFHRRKEAPNVYYCSSIFHDMLTKAIYRQIYMLFIWLAVFCIPLLLIIVSYTLIVGVIWRKAREHAVTSESAIRGQNYTMNLRRALPLYATTITRTTFSQAKIKTLKMTIVIVLTFIVCNLPYYVQEMIFAFGNHDMLNMSFVAISGIISASNSAANPYIFLLFHSRNKIILSVINSFCLSCVNANTTFLGVQYPTVPKRSSDSSERTMSPSRQCTVFTYAGRHDGALCRFNFSARNKTTML